MRVISVLAWESSTMSSALSHGSTLVPTVGRSGKSSEVLTEEEAPMILSGVEMSDPTKMQELLGSTCDNFLTTVRNVRPGK